MSVYSLAIAREYGKGIRDAQSRNEKWIYFMLSNNKFLEKGWYGGHPWIRLAMESESMVEKGINFISQFSFWALAPLQMPTSLCEGPFFYFMQFLFLKFCRRPLL